MKSPQQESEQEPLKKRSAPDKLDNNLNLAANLKKGNQPASVMLHLVRCVQEDNLKVNNQAQLKVISYKHKSSS